MFCWLKIRIQIPAQPLSRDAIFRKSVSEPQFPFLCNGGGSNESSHRGDCILKTAKLDKILFFNMCHFEGSKTTSRIHVRIFVPFLVSSPRDYRRRNLIGLINMQRNSSLKLPWGILLSANKKIWRWVGELGQQVKVLTTKSDDLSSALGSTW